MRVRVPSGPPVLDPGVVGGGEVGGGFAGVDDATGFDDHGVALGFGAGDVFFAPGDDEEFALFDRDGSVAEFDDHFAREDKEGFVGVVVTVPDKVALELDEFELEIVELCDDARSPVVLEEGEFLGEVDGYGGVGHGETLPVGGCSSKIWMESFGLR